MSTIHDPRYVKLIEALREARRKRGLTQTDVAQKLSQPQSYIAKVEIFERRLDIVELFDWLDALNYDLQQFFLDIGWFVQEKREQYAITTEKFESNAPIPIRGVVEEDQRGVFQILSWQGQTLKILLESITGEQYIRVEQKVSELFSSLNESKTLKNREAIAEALEYAIDELPNLNPSDIYQHIIYRIYLREYHKSKPEQSWVRAGGEGLELFIEHRYAAILNKNGIRIKALLSRDEKSGALKQMGLSGQVGDSKLDLVLYGKHKENWVIFGGVHSKASLAERVSDDVPCSRAMMGRGYASFLYTFDSKSFPPPQGDLVNRGELGSHLFPTDKRKYIEEYGDFDACFSYNSRTHSSTQATTSGKKILTSSMRRDEDIFPNYVIDFWDSYKLQL